MSPKNREVTILQKIKQTRTEKGFSQEYMAYKLGIDQSTYYKIESGSTSIKLYLFFSIVDILEIDLLTFLSGCFLENIPVNEVSNKISEIERLLSEVKKHTLFGKVYYDSNTS